MRHDVHEKLWEIRMRIHPKTYALCGEYVCVLHLQGAAGRSNCFCACPSSQAKPMACIVWQAKPNKNLLIYIWPYPKPDERTDGHRITLLTPITAAHLDQNDLPPRHPGLASSINLRGRSASYEHEVSAHADSIFPQRTSTKFLGCCSAWLKGEKSDPSKQPIQAFPLKVRTACSSP